MPPMTSAGSDPNDLENLKNLATTVLAEARKQGATAAAAGISAGNGLSATARMGEVETLEFHQSRSVSVTVFLGQRKGSASSADFAPGALKDTVAAAVNIARYTEEDEFAGLADAELMATGYQDPDLDYPWALEAEQAIELAVDCEAVARSADKRIVNSEGASVSSQRGASVYANSHDFVGGYSATRHSVSCSVVGGHNGGMQRDYWYAIARDRAELEDVQSVGRKAADRTLRRLGARQLSTCTVPVVFAAEIARSLIGHLVSAVGGTAIYRKASFLLDYPGKPVFPDFVRIHEQPHLPRQLGSGPFDSEGVATRDRDLVSAGILQGYVLSSYSARRLGTQTTGNAGGVRNLTIESGDKDLAGLLKTMDKGLLVTELIGQGPNIVTGDYSRGASGFWVEGGEIQYPVEEITIAGNLGDMFMNLVAVGDDVDLRGNIRCGSILLEQMTIAGK